MSSTKIKVYSKSELAALYLPHIQPASARKTLNLWIDHNPELKEELARARYSPRAILLTPKQVGIIFKYLGRP